MPTISANTKRCAYVFPCGPFRGRPITAIADEELREALNTLPHAQPDYYLLRAALEHEHTRRQKAAAARAKRAADSPERAAQRAAARDAATRQRDARQAAALAAATAAERAACEAALSATARRAALRKILDRLDREQAERLRAQQRRDEQARRDAYAATRAAWQVEYLRTHPEDTDDLWALTAAWRRAERAQSGPAATRTPRRDGDDATAMLEIIAAGRKALARKLHPDAGGTDEAMVRANQAADALEQLTTQLTDFRWLLVR